MTEIIKKFQGKQYGCVKVGAVMSVAVLLGAVMSLALLLEAVMSVAFLLGAVMSVALLLGAVMSVALLLGAVLSVARLSGPSCRGRFDGVYLTRLFCRGRFVLGRFVGVPKPLLNNFEYLTRI